MKFVDSCEVHLVAGQGGNGCVAFRREKFVPHGGPSGGDGGKGGDVIFVADSGLSTLLDFTHARIIKAEPGEPGRGKDCYGKGGANRELRVPVGTQVFDVATGNLLCDLDVLGTRFVVAKGGRGGRGNIHFATSFDRAPHRAEPGESGEEKDVRLELKVMADVGLLGFPNVGKSTFIRAVSAAKPKVAEYPFTTLVPHLGVVRVDEDSSFVMADIPGLIPGAAEGAGLGIQFLKHVERTRALLHLLTVDLGGERDPVSDYDVLMNELRQFDPDLANRPMIVALNQADRTDVREIYPDVRAKMGKRGVDLRLVSAVSGEGVRELVFDLFRLIRGQPLGRPDLVPEPPSENRLPQATSDGASPKEEAKAKRVAAKRAKKAAKTKRPSAAATNGAAPKKSAPKKETKRAAPKKAPPKKKTKTRTKTKPKPVTAPKKKVAKPATKKAKKKRPSATRTARKKATGTKSKTAKKTPPKKAPAKKAGARNRR